MSHLIKTEKDTASINIIREETWLNYYTDLRTNPVKKDINPYTGDVTTADLLTYDELEEILKSFKNKTPGNDDMNVELIKYAPLGIKYRFLELLNICWKTQNP